MAGLLDYWASIAGYVPNLLHACWVVLQLTVLCIVVSWVCGLAAALGKVSPYRIFRWPADFFHLPPPNGPDSADPRKYVNEVLAKQRDSRWIF